MNDRRNRLSERIFKSDVQRLHVIQWEAVIGKLLRRLELSEEVRAEAEAAYRRLGDRIAARLGIGRAQVEVSSQGSMRTQTTVPKRGRTNFDLDIVVRLSGPKYEGIGAEALFAEFGKALEGNESATGTPTARRRCWRLPYPGKPFYFDVTPAVPDTRRATGAALKVRDPDTEWSPTNPEEFAVWFCEQADLHFSFHELLLKGGFDARGNVAPLPNDDVGIRDVLRRLIQLMKLHRDSVYFGATDERKDAQPISVILVTLAAQAYQSLWATSRDQFKSPIELALAVVEAMPDYIGDRNGQIWIANPKLGSENFADKWNLDDGQRRAEFFRWHSHLERDLETLLTGDADVGGEDRIRAVFGVLGVEAWKAGQPKTSVLDGLLAAAPGGVTRNPTSPPRSASNDTLG